VIEGLQFGQGEETVDPQTGAITTTITPVLPSHFKEPTTGVSTEVENPNVWVYQDGEGIE